MDKDVVNGLSRFKLTCKEEEGVILEQRDVIESKKECGKSLVVKIWGGEGSKLLRHPKQLQITVVLQKQFESDRVRSKLLSVCLFQQIRDE